MRKNTTRSYGYRAIRSYGRKTIRFFDNKILKSYIPRTLKPYILITFLSFLITLLPYNPTPSARAAIPGSEGVTVSPPLTELTIKKGEKATGAIKLTNPLDKIVELYTSAYDFLPEGETGGQKFMSATSETRKFSLASWISIEKSVAALTPEEVEEVNYTISVPPDAEPCGHYGVIFFSSQPPKLEGDKTQIALASQVGALFLVNVPETVPGECTPSGVVETFDAPWLNLKTPVSFLTRIYNNANVHFKPLGETKIKNWRGVIIDGIKFNEGSGNVLPLSTRRFENQWKADGLKWYQKIGRFQAQLGVVYGEQGKMKSLSDTLVFWIIPWWIFVILGLILALIIWLIIRWWRKKKKMRSYQLDRGGQRPILR